VIFSYLPILFLLILAILFPLGLLVTTSILGPKVKNQTKTEAYECGVPAVGSLDQGLSIKFYRVAILFLLFDVEAALLFPWAVLFRHKLPEWGILFLIVESTIFLSILVAGYFYAWHRGALEWD